MFAREQHGSINVEFLVVVTPFLMLILGIIQLVMLQVAATMTQHAANEAVRAAVVVLDDDPRYYGGAPRNSLEGGLLPSDPVDDYIQRLGLGGGPSASATGSARLQAIRGAASIPLLAIASPVGSEERTSVEAVIGSGRPEDLAGGSARYNRAAVAVTFPEFPRARSLRTRFGQDDDVTVRVTYLYHCGVPLIRYVMCDSPGDARASDGADELRFAERPWASEVLGLSGARFKVIQAEATLPNHGAPYAY